jgi:hypothetical protein
MEYDNILPETISVQKNLDNGEFSFGFINGSLTDIEKKLFTTCSQTVTLKNCWGKDIEYYIKRSNTEIVNNIPTLHYFYDTPQRVQIEHRKRNFD